MILWQRIEDRFSSKVRHAPRRWIFMIPVANMENLPDSLRAITILHEILRERHRIGTSESEIRPQVIDPETGGAHPSHQRVSRRRANRLVAIRPLKEHSSFRQTVDIRRMNLLVPIAP